jgi:hypothetical protein
MCGTSQNIKFIFSKYLYNSSYYITKPLKFIPYQIESNFLPNNGLSETRIPLIFSDNR